MHKQEKEKFRTLWDSIQRTLDFASRKCVSSGHELNLSRVSQAAIHFLLNSPAAMTVALPA